MAMIMHLCQDCNKMQVRKMLIFGNWCPRYFIFLEQMSCTLGMPKMYFFSVDFILWANQEPKILFSHFKSLQLFICQYGKGFKTNLFIIHQGLIVVYSNHQGCVFGQLRSRECSQIRKCHNIVNLAAFRWSMVYMVSLLTRRHIYFNIIVEFGNMGKEGASISEQS